MPTLVFTALALAFSSGNDWPQYNGRASDRSSSEALGAKSFPKDGPKARWRSETGPGFSSLAVVGKRAYTLVLRDGDEVLVALDAESGKEQWSAKLSEPDYDGGADAGEDGNDGGDGPRATPSVVEGRVFTYDANLVLYAHDAATGKELWKQDIADDFGGQKIQWNNAASALVEGAHVFVVGGGESESLLAFEAATGKLAWKSGSEKMTHATPIAATLHGKRQVIFFVQSGLIAVEPTTGAELWRAEFPYRTSTAASPVVSGDVVFCSAGYGVGAAAWRVDSKDEKLVPELLWRTPNKNINHWSTPVVHDGHLYGMFSFKEYGKGPLRCIELETGEEKWAQAGFGPGNVILVGGTLVALSDKGELVLVDPRPDAYQELARADVLPGKCWSMPAFAGGALYLRSTQESVRIDMGTSR
jgi:outer membrane protein assembly factor BamB